MFEISITQEFAAAHRLLNYEGPCSNMHGHTWKVKVSVVSPELNETGMVVDFKDLKAALLSILERYDHGCLNEIAPFDKINPTAENLAKQIYGEMKKSCVDCELTRVEVWEAANSSAAYWELSR